MMDERRIEAALRAEPLDEPKYRGDVAARLRARTTGAGREEPPEHVVEVFELAPRRPRPWPAVSGAAAAAVVLVVALAIVARPQQRPPATTPTTVTPAPSTSIAPGSVPAVLVGRWVGATPRAVTTPNPSAPAFVVLGEDRVTLEHLAGGIVNDFNSQVTETGGGRLRLTLVDQIGSCAAGAIGDYRWTLSPQGTILTVKAISDECPTRAAAFAGEWTHTACPGRGSDCLGPLEAGHHASVNFDPFVSNTYGEVAYDVTGGWSSPVDDKTRLSLLPTEGDTSGVHGLYLFADVAPTTAGCAAAPSTATGQKAIAAALSATPGLSVITTEATVGAYQAQVFDLSAAATAACAGKQPVLASRPGAPTSWTLAIGAGRRMRIVLVDLPGDHTMAVVVASDRSAAEYAQLLDAATAVIDSFVLSASP